MILRLIYSFLYSIALILIFPSQYRKRPKELRKRWLMEKLGGLPDFRASRLIWIHAVSVGEVMASIPLLRRLKEKFPSYGLVISTITDTGQKIAQEKAPEGTEVVYLPFDLVFVLRKALRAVKPSLFINMETELWPNLFYILKAQGIPLAIMNGRISDKSFSNYKKIKFLMNDMIECVNFFGMQDAVYSERIKALGAPEGKVKAIGNFKFDIRPSENIPGWTKLLSQPVIIAGSTHRGEEEIILSAYETLKGDFPGLNLIIAPRHPERFREVEELVESKGLEYAKKSDLAAMSHQLSSTVIILDAIGELASVYGAADIAIMGGSFIEHGGQNPLEPSFWSKPIICGPHMENFFFIKEFYDKKAAIETDDAGLIDRLRDLLKSPEKRNAIGSRARELYNEKSGAVDRAIKEIEKYLKG